MKKKIPGLSLAALTTAALLSVPAAQAQYPQQGPPPPPPDYGHEVWANPPAEVQGVEARGFHDGIEGARKDYENHRPPNVENREEFRHPPVDHHDREAYRHGFWHGYNVGVQHLMRGYPHSY